MPKLSQQKLERHLFGAADILRGRTAGQDYKTYILTLMFFKRLSDQWDYEAEDVIKRKEHERGAPFTEVQRQALIKSGNIHRFVIPAGCHWQDVLNTATNIGESLTRATRGIGQANAELMGVFTVDWNQPAPDGEGTLIPNPVISALVQHFNAINLSNANVEPDILGRAYEYLIKYFADDAGAKAGEFFTPPEVVDVLIRCLEPQPGETVYDPTCGSGGMLVHSANFLKEQGHRADEIRYRGQEMNWSTYAISRINMILHGLEADIRGGKSTLTDPQFLKGDGSIEQFDVAIANFPFSDEVWFLPEAQRTEDEVKKAKKGFAKAGYKDPFGRFTFGQPPASNGDYAFIQHIIASTNNLGRCGVVCPQGVLFRGQPEIEEETGEFDAKGNLKIRRRKADDEYLIRKGMLDARIVDAIIALPLNIFYGAGVPACLLLMNKDRPTARRDNVLLIYAARHYRELSAQNQLRPQDVMRILVHYHAYGDAARSEQLIEHHAARLSAMITQTEADECALINEEYQVYETRLAELQAQLLALPAQSATVEEAPKTSKIDKVRAALEKQMAQPRKKLAERDERLNEAHKRAEEERQAIQNVASELREMYADPNALARHARVVAMAEVEENEFNLNIPRYVDTFEPEKPIDMNATLADLDAAERAASETTRELRRLLKEIGYEEVK